MSTVSNPMPQPAQPVKPVPAPAAEPPRPRSKAWVGLLLLAALVAAGVYLWRGVQSEKQAEAQRATGPNVKTFTVAVGTIERRARLNGVTSARNFATLVGPRVRSSFRGGDVNILKLADSGSIVTKGQIVAELDAQRLKDNLDDEIAELREKDNDILKRKAEQALDLEKLQQSLLVAKTDLEKAQLDQKTTPIRIDLDREVLQLGVDEATAALKEKQQDLQYQLASQKADLRMLEISRRQQEIDVERYQSDVEKFTMRAPISGMVVMQSMMQGGGAEQRQIQVGDIVGPGMPFMKIVDTSTMQVEAIINQTESNLFRIGQEATVELDAFPGSSYPAKVYSIGALAVAGGRAGNYVRTVPVRLQILKGDQKMIPDLTAAASILLEREENQPFVPMAAVDQTGAEPVVEVKTDKGYEKRVVSLGLSDGARVAIRSGLKSGEVVRTY